jgi:hypothetical protein
MIKGILAQEPQPGRKSKRRKGFWGGKASDASQQRAAAARRKVNEDKAAHRVPSSDPDNPDAEPTARPRITLPRISFLERKFAWEK